MAAFRQATDISPGIVWAPYNLGIALNAQGGFDEAITAWREVVRLRPDFADAYSNVGAALQDLGRFEEAVAACRHAVRIKPVASPLGNATAFARKIEDAYRTMWRRWYVS
jgi:Flp pilus assembly protein TadD